MKLEYCHQCMRKRPPEEQICPACGYMHASNPVVMNVLKPESILNGRYLLGNMQKQEPDCVFYAALDLQKDTVVTIREYFPKDKAARAGDAVTWSVPMDEVQKLLTEFKNQNKNGEPFLENGTIYCAEKLSAAELKKPVNTAAAGSKGAPSAKAQAAVKNVGSQKKKTQKKRGFKGVAAIIIVVALVLGWCALFHWQGDQALKQGDYDNAIHGYEMDFLFGAESRREAIRQAGESAFEAGDFPAAAKYFTLMGPDGQARKMDAIYEHAKLLIQEGKYDGAIEELDSMGEEERAAALKGVAQLEKAKELYRNGKTDLAIELAKSIENTTQTDVVAFLNLVYMNEADIQISRENYQKAVEAYRECQDNEEADFNRSVLEKLLDDQVYEAATVISEQLSGSASKYSLEEWRQIVENVVESLSEATNLETRLSREAALGLLAEPFDFYDESHADRFKSAFSLGDMVDETELDNDRSFAVDSLEALYSQCGTNPSGKILIVLQTHRYSSRTQAHMVHLGAMGLLPAQYYPASLEEVEYIALVSYDYTKAGSYTKGTVALRENAKITVYRMPEIKSVATSGSLRGDSAPYSFFYYGTAPVWKSGGAPNVGSKLYEMLKKIM